MLIKLITDTHQQTYKKQNITQIIVIAIQSNDLFGLATHLNLFFFFFSLNRKIISTISMFITFPFNLIIYTTQNRYTTTTKIVRNSLKNTLNALLSQHNNHEQYHMNEHIYVHFWMHDPISQPIWTKWMASSIYLSIVWMFFWYG